MSKKKKESAAEKKSLEATVRSFGMSTGTYLSRHRFIVVIIIVGIALSFALIKTRSAIDVSRNETRYNEEVLKINYQQINNETLESFRLAEEDRKVEVNSSFDPTRQNPFVEN